MKILRLSLSLAFSFIRRSPLVFIYYFFGMTVAFCLTMLFSSDILYDMITNSYNYDFENMSHSYTVTDIRHINETVNDIADLPGIENAGVIVITQYTTSTGGSPFYCRIGAWSKTLDDLGSLINIWGRSFSDEELKGGASVCKVSHLLNSSALINNTVFINGTELTIIGKGYTSNSCDFLVPVKAFERMGLEGYTLIFLPSATATEAEINAADAFIREHCNVTAYEPPVRKWLSLYTYISKMGDSLLVIILSVTAFAVFYSYILKKRTKLFAICRMHGAGVLTLYLVLIIENTVFMTFSYLTAVTISFFLKSIFRFMDTTSFSYAFKSSLPLYALIFVISVVVLLIPSLSLLRKSGLKGYLI